MIQNVVLSFNKEIMNQVHFLDFNKTVTASQDESILDAALEAKIPVPTSCGGNGTCGTCLILVQEGLENCLARNEIEDEIASDRGFANFERLSCQLQITGNIKVKIP